MKEQIEARLKDMVYSEASRPEFGEDKDAFSLLFCFPFSMKSMIADFTYLTQK